MALEPGEYLGSFEVTGLLGQGGMGEVYRARDLKLGREVAIKVLPEAFALDGERRARFEREAKVLAALDHPNIGAVYDFQAGQVAPASSRPAGAGAGTMPASPPREVHFLVMQLLEGETLAERIARGPLSIEEALPIFAQIAEGLEAAHEKGVIHRDLKPANVKIGEDGRARVLDFGLAMPVESGASSIASPSDQTKPAKSPPKTKITTDGAVLGTPAYMSPEQARGRPIDKRADIWAFGCCLYEALTGKLPFDEETVSDTIASVLKADVNLDALPKNTPWKVRELIDDCLQKDPHNRLRDIGDARKQLRKLTTESGRLTSAADFTAPPRRTGRTVWIVLSLIWLATAAGTGIAGWLSRPIPHPPPEPERIVRRYEISPPDGEGQVCCPKISPDGMRLIYRHADHPHIKVLTEFENDVVLTDLQNMLFSSFSPDSRRVAYLEGTRDRPDRDLLRLTPVGGGGVRTIEVPSGSAKGCSWGDGGWIVFGSWLGGLVRVLVETGGVEDLTVPKTGTFHRNPNVLPGGRGVLFNVIEGFFRYRLAVLSLDTGDWRLLGPDGRAPEYLPTGHILYGHDDTLWAVPFDLDTLTLRGEPMPVVPGVKVDGAAHFSVSNDGTLVYVTAPASATRPDRQLVWVDRSGGEEVLEFAGTGQYGIPYLQPRGDLLAVTTFTGPNVGPIVLFDIRRSMLVDRIGVGTANDSLAWTRDGSRLAFVSNRDGPLCMYWTSMDDPSRVERLIDAPSRLPRTPMSWSPDGETLLFQEFFGGGRTDILALTRGTGAEPVPFVADGFGNNAPEFSPDGRWVAYTSDRTGVREVYVRPFSGPGRTWKITDGGGFEPSWNPQGGELFYRTRRGEKKMMVVRVKTDGEPSPSAAEVLFEDTFVPGISSKYYDMASDGQRFLMVREVMTQRSAESTASPAEVASPTIRVVENFFEELKRLVPVEGK